MQIAPIPVDRFNFWVAFNSMIARRVETGIPCRRITVNAPLTHSEMQTFAANMPIGLGGKNVVASSKSIKTGISATEEACTRMVVQCALECLQTKMDGLLLSVRARPVYGALSKAIGHLLLAPMLSLINGYVEMTMDEIPGGAWWWRKMPIMRQRYIKC